jgi:quercetin dioxygenase-like cupin family protein
MEKETLKTKSFLRIDNNSHKSSLNIFDLPVLIGKMKQEYAWTKGDLNTKILFRSPNKQIVLTTLHEGIVIDSFQSNDSITFQIIEGLVQFHTRKESITLEKGQLLTLHENVKYSLTTWEETALLLTIISRVLQPAENL